MSNETFPLLSCEVLASAFVPEALLKTLNFAQKYTQKINWSDFDTATQMLKDTHAFLDANMADEDGIRLELPY